MYYSNRKFPCGLTQREWVVLRMFGGGIVAKQVGLSLGIGKETVITIIKRCKEKLALEGYYYTTKTDLSKLIEEGVF